MLKQIDSLFKHNAIHATAIHRPTAVQIHAPNLTCAGTWNGKQDQKRGVCSGEMQQHRTGQLVAVECRTKTTPSPWHHTPLDGLEHHSVDQPNAYIYTEQFY